MKLLVLLEIVKWVTVIHDAQCTDVGQDGTGKSINQSLKYSQCNWEKLKNAYAKKA